MCELWFIYLLMLFRAVLLIMRRGTVTTLKLSPNLRIKEKPPKKGQNIDQSTLQVQKLDKLLSLVRELPEDTEEADKVSDASDYDS